MAKRILYDIKGNKLSYLLIVFAVLFITVLMGISEYMLDVYDKYRDDIIDKTGIYLKIEWEEMPENIRAVTEKINKISGVISCETSEDRFINSDIFIIDKSDKKTVSKEIKNEYCYLYGMIGYENNLIAEEFRLIEGELPKAGESAAVDTVTADKYDISIGDALRIKNNFSDKQTDLIVTGIVEAENKSVRAYPVSQTKADPYSSKKNIMWKSGEIPYPTLLVSFERYISLIDISEEFITFIDVSEYGKLDFVMKEVKNILSGENVYIENATEWQIQNTMPNMQIVKHMITIFDIVIISVTIFAVSFLMWYWIKKHDNEFKIYTYLGMNSRKVILQFFVSLILAVSAGVAAGTLCYNLVFSGFGEALAEQFYNLNGEMYIYAGADKGYYNGSGNLNHVNSTVLPYNAIIFLICVFAAILEISLLCKRLTHKQCE